MRQVQITVLRLFKTLEQYFNRHEFSFSAPKESHSNYDLIQLNALKFRDIIDWKTLICSVFSVSVRTLTVMVRGRTFPLTPDVWLASEQTSPEECVNKAISRFVVANDKRTYSTVCSHRPWLCWQTAGQWTCCTKSSIVLQKMHYVYKVAASGLFSCWLSCDF